MKPAGSPMPRAMKRTQYSPHGISRTHWDLPSQEKSPRVAGLIPARDEGSRSGQPV